MTRAPREDNRAISPLSINLLAAMMAVLALVFSAAADAEKTITNSDMSLGEAAACPVSLPDDMDWSPAEVWAWDRLCRGLQVDLSKLDEEPDEAGNGGVACEPDQVKAWPENRTLGMVFVSTITDDMPYREIIAQQGLSIRCAHIEGGIAYYEKASFRNSIRIDDSYIQGDLDLSGSSINGDLTLINTIVEYGLSLAQMRDIESVYISDSEIHTDIDMSGLYVSDYISMVGSVVKGDVDLAEARADSRISVSDTTIIGDLYAYNMTVNVSFYMRDGSVGSIDLGGTDVGRGSFRSMWVNGDVDLTGFKSGDNFFVKTADIGGALDASGMSLGRNLTLADMRISSIDLSGARIGGNVDLLDVDVGIEGISGEAMSVEGNFGIVRVKGPMAEAPMLGDVAGENIGESGGSLISLSGSTVNGSVTIALLNIGALELGDMIIDRSFSVGASELNYMVLKDTNVRNTLGMVENSIDVLSVMGGQLGNVVIEKLCTNHVYFLLGEIQGNMLFTASTIQNGLTFTMTEIGGNVGIQPVLAGDMEFAAVNIGASLILAGEYLEDVTLDLTSVDGSVILTKGRFLGRVNLDGIEVGRELVLATSEQQLPDWEEGVELSLRDAQVGELRHEAASWKELGGRYGIDGLQYERLIFEGVGEAGQEPVWVLDWLRGQKERGASFNPQPYEELVKALRRSGFVSLSNDVAVMARNHELVSNEASLARKINLFLQKHIIGYGYQTWRAFMWLALLILIGTYVSGKTCWGRRSGYARRLFFSMDMLLPQMAQLDKRHEELKLGGSFVWCPEVPIGAGEPRKTLGPLTMPIQYYFFMHKLIGSILMLFAIAGLSGLTK